MRLLNIVLCILASTAPLIAARSTLSSHQEVLREPNTNANTLLTIAIETATSLTRHADKATIELKLTAPTVQGHDNATKALNLLTQDFERNITHFQSTTPSSPIESWEPGQRWVYDACCDNGEWVTDPVYGDRSFVTEDRYATLDIGIRVANFDRAGMQEFRQLVTNIINASSVEFHHIEWDLSDAASAALRSELRRKAVGEMTVAAQEYAGVFGVGEVRPVELEEQRLFTRSVYPRRFGAERWFGGEDGEFEAEEVEMTLVVKGKFAAV